MRWVATPLNVRVEKLKKTFPKARIHITGIRNAFRKRKIKQKKIVLFHMKVDREDEFTNRYLEV